MKKCGLTGAGQRHHVGGLGRRADPPAVGGSDPELVVTSGYEAVDLKALLPAAGRLLPQQRVWWREEEQVWCPVWPFKIKNRSTCIPSHRRTLLSVLHRVAADGAVGGRGRRGPVDHHRRAAGFLRHRPPRGCWDSCRRDGRNKRTFCKPPQGLKCLDPFTMD